MKDFEFLGLRSITYTIDVDKILELEYRKGVEEDIRNLVEAFTNKNIFIRTLRLNVVKIEPATRLEENKILHKIHSLEEFSRKIGIRWFNICFDLIKQDKKNTKIICRLAYEIVKRYPRSFINLIISNEKQMNVFAALCASKTILDISKLSFNGYDNFRFGISLNPSNGTPFFPFSFSDRDRCFSLAVEITERMINCIKINKHNLTDLKRLKEDIFKDLSPFVIFLDKFCKEISDNHKINYGGQDLSLAPFPEDKISVVEILHLLGLDDIGSNGSLYFTSYLTGIIKSLTRRNNVKPAGFNGVMYSLLEDHLMCRANDKKLLSIDQIIGYSTLCGCGLDMVPIPGNSLVEELASIVLDLAATASRLDKPLGFRVLPIPNKNANEYTEFDMDFLTNTRVMDLKQVSSSLKTFDQLNMILK